jgi:hypothetical protein
LDGKTIPEPVLEFSEGLWKTIRGAAIRTKKVADAVGEISIDTNPAKTRRKMIAKVGMATFVATILFDRIIMMRKRRK